MASGSLLPAFAEPAQPEGGYQYMMDQSGSGNYAMPSGSGGGSNQMGMAGPQQTVYYATPQQQHQHPQMYQQQHLQQQQYQQPMNMAQYTHQSAHSIDAESSQGQGGVTGASGGNGQAIVYITTYNGISVYESMIRNVAVMMRRTDRWLNATQILKVAGINKAARAKIVDLELALGEHEKVHAGYGKYQGTWVPYPIGQKVALKYHVHHLLTPLFQLGNEASEVSTRSFPAVTPQKRMGSPSAGGSVTSHRQSVGSNGRTSSRSGGEGFSPPGGMAGSVDLGQGGDNSARYATPLSVPQPTYGLQAAPNMSTAPSGPSKMGKRARSVSSQDGEPASKRPKAEESADGHLAAAFMPTVPEVDDSRAPSEADVSMNSEREGSAESNGERHPMPPNTVLANKATRPQMNAPFGVVKLEEAAKSRARVKLLAIFQVSEGEEPDLDRMLQPDIKSSPSGAGDSGAEAFDIDQVIDEKGHTALHWAAALAREDVIAGLISRGADIHRGNFAGETPLIRSVLATNTADANTFGHLLSTHLGSSLRTLDFSHRSVLHHIALVAAIKGRAASANIYMSSMLEWLTKAEDRMSMQAFVNIQDVHGDTALITAARVGNKNLVKLLLDAGADKTLANELGLRPVDFGIDVKGLECASGMISAPSSQTSTDRPQRKGESILRHLTDMIQQVNEEFSRELGEKQERLNRLQEEVKVATRDLAVERRALRDAQARAAEVEEGKQKVTNLDRAIQDELNFDYHHRTDATSPSTTLSNSTDIDPPISQASDQNTAQKLAYMRTVRNWQDRAKSVLEQRLQVIEGAEAERTVQYKKVIAACAKVTVDKVDSRLLEDLTAAVESDGSALDLGRATAFMQRATGAAA